MDLLGFLFNFSNFIFFVFSFFFFFICDKIFPVDIIAPNHSLLFISGNQNIFEFILTISKFLINSSKITNG